MMKANDHRLSRPPVEIIVGQGDRQRMFYVDEGVLKSGGDFFVAALKEGWRKLKEPIKLTEDDPDAFEVYAQWLYTGKIFSKLDPSSMAETGRLFGWTQQFRVLAALFVLGEERMDRAFQDRVMDAKFAINLQTRHVPAPDIVNYIMGRTPKDSPARRWVVHCYIRYGRDFGSNDTHCKHHWLNHLQFFNHEFVAELLIEQSGRIHMRDSERNELKALLERPRCTYHSHGKDVACDGSPGP